MAVSSAGTRARERRIRELQQVGFRGGRIMPHRAMIGLKVGWGLLVDLLLLPVLAMAVLAVLRDPVTNGWRHVFEALVGPLGFPGGVSATRWELGPTTVMLPAFTADAAWPGTLALVVGWVVTVLLAIGGLLLRGWATPFGYLLRAMATIQGTAQLWFTFASPPFTYTLQGYQEAVMYLGCVVVFLVPVGTALTFNVFDFRLWQKLALTGLIVTHLLVLIPLQVATHAFLIRHLTLLAMPMLYLLFGILLHVFAFVALYGWGMSWRSHGELDPLDRRPPASRKKRPPVPSRPGGGDPEAGRRAQAAREAAELATALASGFAAAPSPAPAPATAGPAKPAEAKPAEAKPAEAKPAEAGPPADPPAMSAPAMSAPAMRVPAKAAPSKAAPAGAAPRSGGKVPLLFGGDAGATAKRGTGA